MAIESGMEPERRLRALGHVKAAVHELTHIWHDWTLVQPTRADSKVLSQIILQLEPVGAALADPQGDHWATPDVLRSVVKAMDGMACEELDPAEGEVQSALEAIAGVSSP